MGNEGSMLLDDPKTGEYSRYGITLQTAAALKLCQPGDKSFIDFAKAFYFDHFWVPLRLTVIFDQGVASKLLDMAVNMGQHEAVLIAQRACNALAPPTVVMDGRMGPGTITAINGHDGHEMLLELRAESLQFYRELVTKDPDKYEKYWEDWKERAEK
jgi:lysozyme family protein